MTINRTQTPAVKPLEKISFVHPKTFDITPQTKLYWMSEIADNTVRIELHFDAGIIRTERKTASFTNLLLLSGTTEKTSTQIHNELDSLGAYTDCEVGIEKAVVSIYCLEENVKKVVKIVVDAIQNAAFHPGEVEDAVREGKQNFLVSGEKVNVLARREFQRQFFINDERYAQASS